MNIIREQPGRAGEVGMSFDFLHPSPNSINISEEATALADEMPAIVQDVEEIELIDQNEVHSEEEMSTTARVEELELIDEVQHLLSEFEELKQRNVIENSVDFNDFVNVDANLAITAEVINDAIITDLALLREQEPDDQDGNSHIDDFGDPLDRITPTNALTAISILKAYFMQSECVDDGRFSECYLYWKVGETSQLKLQSIN